MKRIQGIFGLLIAICVGTALYNPLFLNETNIYNVIRWTALYGIISIGVAFVIITGGIDLSVGSVVGLTGCLLAIFLQVKFIETNEVYKVEEVNKESRVLTLDREIGNITDQDAFQMTDPRTGRPRQLSISWAKADGLDSNQAPIRESVSWLQPGTEVTWMRKQHMNIFLAVSLVMLISVGIGLIHGLLITKLKLQPFVVTLCGLLFYRGITRVIAGDQNVGFGPFHDGLKYLARGKPISVPVPFIRYLSKGNWSTTTSDAAGNETALNMVAWISIPMPMIIMIVIAIIAAIFLNKTIYGRYLLALGRNEKAAQYSGINTDRMVILSYIICAALSGLGGILFVLDLNSVQPATHGNFYELYAIAAAVLGGCSLRGGEGSILGVVIGAAVMRALRNSINLVKIPTQLEFAIIGIVILAGVTVDELVKRLVAKTRAVRQAKEMAGSDEDTTPR